jgi:hypothetical protein
MSNPLKYTYYCEVCNKQKEAYKSEREKKYCSKKCYRSIDSRRILKCPVCKIDFIKNRPNQKTCSTECSGTFNRKNTKQCKVCGILKKREEFGEVNISTGARISAYCKPCSLKKHTEWCERNYFLYLMSLIQRNSRSNIKKTIGVDAIFLEELFNKQDGKCALSGLHLILEKHNLNSPSIDRIDSNKGYEKDNIHIVCKIVNLMKHQLTVEQLYEYCAAILKNKKD